MPNDGLLDRAQVEAALRTCEIGRELIHLPSTTSTMDDARRAAEAGCRHGLVVAADEQTAGRGTKGRTWVSPPGESIHATLVVRPAAEQMKRLSIVAAVAAAEAIEAATPLRAELKWPNDVEIGGRKTGGILIEGEWGAQGPRHALVGIGINVNFDPAPHAARIDRPATSLMVELGQRQSREAVLAALLNAFERAYDGYEKHRIFETWRNRLSTLGRRVQVHGADGIDLAGEAEDVETDGALLVRADDGVLHRVIAGELTLRVSE